MGYIKNYEHYCLLPVKLFTTLVFRYLNSRIFGPMDRNSSLRIGKTLEPVLFGGKIRNQSG